MKSIIMEVITYKKQTSETKYIIETTLEYRPPLNISRNFFSQKKINKNREVRPYTLLLLKKANSKHCCKQKPLSYFKGKTCGQRK